MSQIYSVPSRENDPYALPDVDVFYMTADEIDNSDFHNSGTVWESILVETGQTPDELGGWYWWPCLPGCLPDGDPIGPFASEAEAIADAQADAWQFEGSEDDILTMGNDENDIRRVSDD